MKTYRNLSIIIDTTMPRIIRMITLAVALSDSASEYEGSLIEFFAR